jgi:hypothetical protein
MGSVCLHWCLVRADSLKALSGGGNIKESRHSGAPGKARPSIETDVCVGAAKDVRHRHTDVEIEIEIDIEIEGDESCGWLV